MSLSAVRHAVYALLVHVRAAEKNAKKYVEGKGMMFCSVCYESWTVARSAGCCFASLSVAGLAEGGVPTHVVRRLACLWGFAIPCTWVWSCKPFIGASASVLHPAGAVSAVTMHGSLPAANCCLLFAPS
jgi:hypothetical protein